jgi:hypothetical protein
MASDERSKELERAPSNVRLFIPRAVPASKIEEGSCPPARGRNVVDSDGDPGPSAA